MEDKNLQVTPLSELKKYSEGCIVELPDFGEGQSFVAKLKRPSLLVMMKGGKIPNQLLKTANDMFDGKTDNKDITPEKVNEMYDVIKLICEASLVSPSMGELESEGIELTDQQMLAIFNYSQVGAKSLENFRK